MGKAVLNNNYGKMILNGVVYGNNISQINEADIFNHGEIVGLNPYYSYQIGSKYGLTISAQTITLSKSSGYANFCFTMLVDKTHYSKICFDVEVPDTYDGYKDVVVGSRNYDLGEPPQNYEQGFPNKYIQLISWYDQRNYSGTQPWYGLPRCTVKVDISTATTNYVLVELYRHYGDLIIYSMWLEP